MDVNRKRGLKRLVIAVAVPWFGWWALVGGLNYSAYRQADAGWWKAERVEDWETAAIHSGAQARAMEWMELAILWGVAVPIALLIIDGIGLWVYRGFKPKV